MSQTAPHKHYFSYLAKEVISVRKYFMCLGFVFSASSQMSLIQNVRSVRFFMQDFKGAVSNPTPVHFVSNSVNISTWSASSRFYVWVKKNLVFLHSPWHCKTKRKKCPHKHSASQSAKEDICEILLFVQGFLPVCLKIRFMQNVRFVKLFMQSDKH